MLLDHLPEYDAVYVVSDLHLGGFSIKDRDYRIFRESKALAGFIELLSKPQTPPRRACLVLNGDIVDFLADEKPTYFDWVNAVEKLERAVADEQQSLVWQALQAYVASGCGDLVLVLGNHDLELALPDPQHVLLDFLTKQQPAARARVQFAMDGAGFACRVARKRVLCLHGNEVDPWNAVDYGRLSLIRRALMRDSLERNAAVMHDWVPNPGTQLVIQYLNGIKRRRQWIDLLKPEEEATAMISAALERLPAIRTFAEVVAKKRANEKRLADGFMAGSAVEEDVSDVPRAMPPSTQADVDNAILDAIGSLGSGVRPEDMVGQVQDDFLMGVLEQLRRTITLKAWPKTLRETLQQTIGADRHFDIDLEDETFLKLDELCGDVDYLIAGHTHLPRALRRKRFRGQYYYNSGTWISLLRIPKSMLTVEGFPELYRRLEVETDSFKELTKEVDGKPGTGLLYTQRTVVRIEKDAQGAVHGDLLTVEADGGVDTWQLTPVAGSRFP